MPTTKSARARMNDEVNKAISDGNSFLANEITANVMVGTTMMLVFAVMLLALVLNEVGVFTADKTMMRIAIFVAAFVEVPITILNSIYVGTKPWLKIPLMVDLILVCGILSATLGHNVTLVMMFPVIVSTRYFDKKYTGFVAIFSAIVFAVCTLICGLAGIVNLNMLKLPDGMEITILEGETLRSAIERVGIDKGDYLKSLFINDFLPRCFIFLSASVSCAYVAGRGKRMIEMQAENVQKTSRIETELNLATHIQASMLPCIFPAFPEKSEFDIYASMNPAKEVGGDFYDFFMVDDSHLAIVMADVSGKGVPAALFMVIAKTLIKDHTQLGKGLDGVFNRVNELLCESNSEGMFVTAFEGVLDLDTGEFLYVNAGHETPFVCRKGEKFAPYKVNPGFVLAGIEGMNYKVGSFMLSKGDKIFQYTDGVTEATDNDNQLYGMKRLEKILADNSDKTPCEILPAVKNDIDSFISGAPQFDDITMLCLEYKGRD